MAKVPIVDLSNGNLLKVGNSRVCNEIRHAFEEYGCFVAKYDGISPELESEVFEVVKELFDLPIETKMNNKGDMRLYSYIGQLPHAPLHESLGIGDPTKLEGVEKFSHQMWPSGNKRFCAAVLSYGNQIAKLEQLVNKLVFESYGAQKHYSSHVGSTTYAFRPIKYESPTIMGSNIGANLHTDKGFLALIHQNKVNGLELEARNGEWYTVDVPPSSFVVVAGDAYQAWSNDRIHSPRHQVNVRGNKARYSMVTFSFRKGVVEIPEEVVDRHHPLQFNPFDNFDLLRYYNKAVSADMTASTAREFCGIHN